MRSKNLTTKFSRCPTSWHPISRVFERSLEQLSSSLSPVIIMWLYSILPNIEVTVALSQLEATYKSNACGGGVVAFTHGQSEASSLQMRRRFTVPHTVFILQASASFERVALVCHRSHGGQRKLFKDTLKAPLKAFSIAPDHWEEAAQDRTYWRYSVHKGAQQYEATRTAVA